MTSRCQAILFDLDDTLLDGDAAWRAGVDRLLGRCPQVSRNTALTAWESAFHEHYPRYLTGEMSQHDCQLARVRSWAALVSVDLTAGAELSWFADYQAGYEQGWTAFADVAPCLAALAGFRLGVITNGDSEMQRAKLAALGLTSIFDVVVASGDTGIPKPDSQIFEFTAHQLGLPVGECFYVGDRRDTDAQAALAAGMPAAWLNRRGETPPDALIPEITTLATLPRLVSPP